MGFTKFEKVADKNARFECNGIWKMLKKVQNAKNLTYLLSKKLKKDSIICVNLN